ncbi:MAG: TGS domain-containing protein, partial [Dehalococcoidales bacterium]|nr:TGS domain-containing protein [Dehalococcoidales bacterium]
NAGKSQLVAATTNASPLVAEYPFTTQSAMPGMMTFENVQIQLVDTPPLSPPVIEWWLRHTLVRADALLVVVDLNTNPLDQMDEITTLLAKARIKLGTSPGSGETDTVVYEKKALIVGNKLDTTGARENYEILKFKYGDQLRVLAISARTGTGLEELKHEIFQMLNIIRVYTKVPGQKTDLTDPMVMAKGSTLEEAATEIHKDFTHKLKYARIWGSGKHEGIMAKRDHVLQDGDIIELHL